MKSFALSRRKALQLSATALAASGLRILTSPALAEAAEVHGLSTFGELALPADFKNFAYVNPAAPKGGTLAIQISSGGGNQNFETFDTLNIYTFKGDGAAGMDMTFDTLMTGSGDERGSAYGLVARAVKVSEDRLTYRFLLRLEARFNDGSKLTARDAAFSLNLLKQKSHPNYRLLLDKMESAQAEADDVLVVTFAADRSRDAHLVVAGMPIFSAAYWEKRDFEASTLEAPLGSGPYKVSRFVQGRNIEFERVATYWGKDLPVNVGQNNFDHIRYEYFRERQVAFEGFKSGTTNYHEEYTSRFWNNAYDFPAIKAGRVKKEEVPDGKATTTQGWYFNTRRPQFKDPRIREALGMVFDFEWTNKNIMYSSYKRLVSYFQNTPMQATGVPGPGELALLERWRGKVPDEVFGEPFVPPVSDGSGADRSLLRRADDMLKAAGCKRDGSRLLLPDGKPFAIEFLDSNPALLPHTEPFQANLKKLGIAATSRLVDSAQYKARLDNFDFDMLTAAHGGTATPGDEMRIFFSSISATTPGSRNLGGIADPAVDDMIQRIGQANTRDELDTAARALDRLLRAGRYWIPMWYRNVAWLAYWDAFDRPAVTPKYSTGAPGTWWWDAEKAKKNGVEG